MTRPTRQITFYSMPEVADPPIRTPYFADPERAKEARAKQTELAHQSKQELENLRLILATKPLEPAEQPKLQTRADLEASNQIALANELVTHARNELKRITEDDYGFCPECKRHGADAKEQAALLRELRGLMEHLCRLHNIAQAPTSKAQAPRSRATQAPPMPVPVVPQSSGQ